MDAITHNGSDAETPHLAGGIGDNLMVILQTDAEAPVWKNFGDQAFEGHEILFGHQAVRPTGD